MPERPIHLRRLARASFQGLGRGSRLLRSGLTGLILAAAAASAQAPLDVRVALVIGNGAYAHVPTLQNPVNDAEAMSTTLRLLGFTVTELRDGSREQMQQALDAMRKALDGKQGIGVLYYAGHGVQLDLRNYMIPVEAKLTSAADVPRQALDLSQVIEIFKRSGNRMSIVMLDACRDNPFSDGVAGKGLAPMDAPNNTFLAYATAPGNVAEDGDPTLGNGLYTGYLVKELQKPATRIEDVFKRVRLQVRRQSSGRQIPWESTSLEEDFYFNDGVKYTFRPEDFQRVRLAAREREAQLRREVEQAKEREQQQAALRALEVLRLAEAQRRQEMEAAQAQAREAQLQREAQQAKEREQQQAALRALEALRLAEAQRLQEVATAQAQAREAQVQREAQQAKEREQQQAALRALEAMRLAEAQRLLELEAAQVQAREADRLRRLSEAQAQEQAFRAEQTDWHRIQSSEKVDDYYAFLNKYPSGYVSEEAWFRIENLQRAQILAQSLPDMPKTLPAGALRFALGDEDVWEWTEGFTKRVERRVTRVTAVSGDRVELNHGNNVMTQSGMILKNGVGRHEPGILMAPANLSVGKRWRTAFETERPDGGKNVSYWNYKVTALEEVTVPAGVFKAYKVEGYGFVNRDDGRVVQMRGALWIDPATMRPVRDEQVNRNDRGQTIMYFNRVLVKRTLAARSGA